jgi:hypothetical protein
MGAGSMPYAKVIHPDAGLPHQIVISATKSSSRLTVSCNCMPVGRGPCERRPMMTFASGTEASVLLHAWRISKQHRTHKAPFDHKAIDAARRGPAYRLA